MKFFPLSLSFVHMSFCICICICAYFYCFDSSVAGLSSPFIKFIFMKMIFMLTFVLYNVFIMFLVAAALVRKTTTTPNKTLFHSSVNELINPKKEYKQNDLFIVVFFWIFHQLEIQSLSCVIYMIVRWMSQMNYHSLKEHILNIWYGHFLHCNWKF